MKTLPVDLAGLDHGDAKNADRPAIEDDANGASYRRACRLLRRVIALAARPGLVGVEAKSDPEDSPEDAIGSNVIARAACAMKHPW
jgi:hypothetical protein